MRWRRSPSWCWQASQTAAGAESRRRRAPLKERANLERVDRWCISRPANWSRCRSRFSTEEILFAGGHEASYAQPGTAGSPQSAGDQLEGPLANER